MSIPIEDYAMIGDCHTAALVPKAIVSELPPALAPKPPLFLAGGLIYEANVRALTIRHPDIPATIRGTLAAVAEVLVARQPWLAGRRRVSPHRTARDAASLVLRPDERATRR